LLPILDTIPIPVMTTRRIDPSKLFK